MSYLDDPRVFLATERTLLAWIRTEIAILAVAFLLKKFGVEGIQGHTVSLNIVVLAICLSTVVLSILSFVHSALSINKLSEKEVPGRMAKPLIYLAGGLAVLICVGSTFIVMSF